jgi:tRNA A-37 threonylcarbamoyl transferase component Bud32
MGCVRIHSGYQETFHRRGLVRAQDFLRLPGVILCGHPDRHVLRVEKMPALLKKEHRVPWRDLVANAWDGFGFVSKSTREAKILHLAEKAKIPCPQVLAHGHSGPQAFLLVEDKSGMMEIRQYVQQHPQQKTRVARALGREIARMHAAGFEHGELFTKHILIGPDGCICFLDWQRARLHKNITRNSCCRDLAKLDATLPTTLASDRMRRTLLRDYLRHFLGIERTKALSSWAAKIRRLSLKLQQKHRIRVLRRLPLPSGSQNLIWLDGEALCITQAFRAELGAALPDWLRFRGLQRGPVETSQVQLGENRRGNLVRRSVGGIGRWLLSWFRSAQAPEVQQAALLFRLERHAVPSAKLLAFGQSPVRPGGRESFLLTENLPSEGTLDDFLAHFRSSARRATWLRQAGALLRGLHDAGYALGYQVVTFASMCAVQKNDRVVLARFDGLKRDTRAWTVLARQDIPWLQTRYELTSTDMMRFFLGYLGFPHLTPDGRKLARDLLGVAAREVAS